MSDNHQHSLNSQTAGVALAPRAEFPITLPAIIERAGPHVVNFFTTVIANRNTRRAYLRPTVRFFEWMDAHALTLETVQPVHVAVWLDTLKPDFAVTSVKQQLTALRMLFDHLVSGGMLDANPTATVAGPGNDPERHETSALDAEEAGRLLDSIQQDSMAGLRDRALIGLMVYAPVELRTALAMRVRDVLCERDRWILRLQVEGSEDRRVLCHHLVVEYLTAYLNAAELWSDFEGPLFRTINRSTSLLSDRPLALPDASEAVRRRVRAAGIKEQVSNHTQRGSALTPHLHTGRESDQARA